MADSEGYSPAPTLRWEENQRAAGVRISALVGSGRFGRTEHGFELALSVDYRAWDNLVIQACGPPIADQPNVFQPERRLEVSETPATN